MRLFFRQFDIQFGGGLRDLPNDGGGAGACVMSKGRALDTTLWFSTVTEAVPGEAMSLAGIWAVSWLALTTVVVRAAPFHCTSEPLTKLLPVTVSVKAAPPATALLGESALNDGAAEPLPSWTILPIDGTPLPLRMKSR